MTEMDTTALIYKVLCDHNGCFELEEMRANISTKEDELKSVLGNQDMFTSTVSEGNKLIVAKTKMRLCRDKECNGCSNLHLCKFYLYGTCRFNEGQQCRFCHELTSEYNIRVLREHHLEELDKRELCTLLLQNDNTLLPPVCFTYNKGSGEYGYCPDKEKCRRLHVCERYITGTCAADVDCGRSHDFNEPHPLNTLQQRGVPNELVPSMLSTYRNIQAIQYEEGSRPVCYPPPPPQTYLPAPNVVQSETHYIHLQPIIVNSQLTPSMLRNFKLKSRPFVQTKPKSHTKPSSSASPQSKPSKPPTPAPHQSKSSQPPPHQLKSSKPPSPAPHQSKSSKPPPPAPHQSKSSQPAPHQSKSSQPAPHQSKSSKQPPPTPHQSKSSQPAPHQSKSSKPPPPAPHQSKSSQPAPHQSKSSKPPPPAPHQSKSSQPAPHQPKTTKAPPSARRR